MKCILCGCENLEKLFKVNDMRHLNRKFALAKCRECAFVATTPKLDPEAIKQYYERPCGNEENTKFKKIYEASERFFRTLRARYINSLKKGKAILDIGCGRGVMLSELNRLGWEAHGCELTDKTAFKARQNKELKIYTKEFEKTELQDNYFDVVSLWHVLEHLDNPKKYLYKIHKILKKEGILIIEVPNIESWQAQVFKQDWFHLDTPRHYYHFSPHTLKRLLLDSGFQAKRLHFFSLEYGPFGVLQSMLNRIGFKNNLLYNMMMKDYVATKESKSFKNKFLMILLSPFLSAVGLLFSFVEAIFWKGVIIRVVAVRNSSARRWCRS